VAPAATGAPEEERSLRVRGGAPTSRRRAGGLGDGRTIGEGDLAAQLEQCYLNVSTALAAAGASFADVVELTLYFVDWTPEKLAMAGEGIARAAETLGITALPPLTGIGVAALAEPGLSVEVEATAVLDRRRRQAGGWARPRRRSAPAGPGCAPARG
jgi:enamine deaminase RidA (YjgF/YER057c/UK114 family)